MSPLHTLVSYFTKQHINFTAKNLADTLLFHPDYPSVSSITNTLNEYQVDNLAVKVDLDRLLTINLPAIAQIQEEKSDEFVLILSIQNQRITYQAEQLITETLEDFNEKWKGMLILLATNPQSGEENYVQNLKEEKQQNIEKWIGFSGVGLFALWGLNKLNNWLNITPFILVLVGLCFTILLLINEFGKKNNFIDKLCHINSNTNCDTVLDSPAAKFLGWLSWSEIGFFYFAGNVLALSNASFEVLRILFIINLTALPYVVFSVYYQAKVVKQWCTLCLGVQVVLVLLFICLGWQTNWLYGANTDLVWIYNGFTTAIGWFLLPMGVWFLLKNIVSSAKKLPQTEKELSAYRRNTTLFKNALSQQPLVATESFEGEILLGNSGAPLLLTMVSNPNCVPCAKAHEIVKQLLGRFPEELKVQIRFVGKQSIIQHLLNFEDRAAFEEVLMAWYRQNDFIKWQELYPQSDLGKGKRLAKQNQEWAKAIDIQFTPTFFINGRLIESPYNLNDLKYHLRNLAEEELIIAE